MQPKKSDAFLNLGVFFTDKGLYESAIAAYQEGLKRTPKCEFLNYNLATLAGFLGLDALAQSALNQAMVTNPSRGLNLSTKGAPLNPDSVRTHQLLVQCYKKQGEEWLARWHLKQAHTNRYGS